MLIGGILVATSAAVAANRLLDTLPVRMVVGCHVQERHGLEALVHLDDGTVVSLNRTEIGDPVMCPGKGVTVERRRWEFSYRVSTRPQNSGPFLSGLAGIAILAVLAIIVSGRK